MRILQTVVDGIPIINTYVPQGYSISSEKYAFKLDWFRRLRRYFESALDPEKPAIWLGDLNVAPEPIDVYHPEKRVNDVDFHIDARKAYKRRIRVGICRCVSQTAPGSTCNTLTGITSGTRSERNFGWRIDHILATAPLADLRVACEVDMEPRRAAGASDHTVVWADFDVPSLH